MAFPIPLREVYTISAKIFCNCNPRDHKSLTLSRRSSGLCSGPRGRVSVKGGLLTVSVLNQNLRQFSAPVKPGSRQSKEDEDKQNNYVNLGYAIRTLREEFPKLFYSEPNFDIYREDIVFRDPINTIAGIDNYKSIFWGLRFHGRIFFRALWVDLMSVWQPAENIIMVRWTVHGIPRVPWESRGRFDGTSEYKLDHNGKIFEHRVDNIAVNSPPKFRVSAVEKLIQSIGGGNSTPRPTYFEISSSSSWRNDSG